MRFPIIALIAERSRRRLAHLANIKQQTNRARRRRLGSPFHHFRWFQAYQCYRNPSICHPYYIFIWLLPFALKQVSAFSSACFCVTKLVFCADCFLVPSLDSGALSEATFAVHWLNNKELIFSLGAEKLLAEALAIEHPGAGGLWYNAPSPVVEHRMTSQSGTGKGIFQFRTRRKHSHGTRLGAGCR